MSRGTGKGVSVRRLPGMPLTIRVAAPSEGRSGFASCRRYLIRIPAVSSKRSTLSDLGNGASSTSPTLTPYFQSGGQIAM